jgi:hypothetical protein
LSILSQFVYGETNFLDLQTKIHAAAVAAAACCLLLLLLLLMLLLLLSSTFTKICLSEM